MFYVMVRNAVQIPSIPSSFLFPTSKWYVLLFPGAAKSTLQALFILSVQIIPCILSDYPRQGWRTLSLLWSVFYIINICFKKWVTYYYNPRFFFLLDTLSEALFKKTGCQYLDIASPTSPLYLWKQGKEVKWFAQGLNYLLANVG